MSSIESIDIAYHALQKRGTLVLREGASAIRMNADNDCGDYWLVILKIDVIPADEYTVMSMVYDDGTIALPGV